LFLTGPGREYRNKDGAFVAGSRNWHKMHSKSVNPGILVTRFQSNDHKASVGDLISFAARKKYLPNLVDKEKRRKRKGERSLHHTHVARHHHHAR